MNAFPAGPDQADRHAILRLANQARAALNRRLFTHAALCALPPLAAGLLAGFLAWRLGAARAWLPGAAWFLPTAPGGTSPALLGAAAILILLCLAAGVPALRRRRLDRAAAARWLDQRLGSRDLLAAGLDCLEAGADPIFAQRIAARAARLARQAGTQQPGFYPWKALAARAGIALAALTLAGGGAMAWNPEAAALAETAAAAERSVSALDPSRQDASPENRATIPSSGPDQEATRLAAKLFPADRRLAALAREALRNQDNAALDYLLAQNNLTRDDLDRLADASPEDARPSPPASQDSDPSGGQSGQDGGGRDKSGQPGDSGQSGQAPGRSGNQPGQPGNQGQQPQGGADGPRGPRNPEGSAQGQGQGQQGDNANNSATGGRKGGFGEANSSTAQRDTAGRLGPDLLVKQPDPAKPFEIVLPEQGTSRPLAAAVPDARRSAESALSRRSAPLSYEQYVMSYFTALSQEANQ